MAFRESTQSHEISGERERERERERDMPRWGKTHSPPPSLLVSSGAEVIDLCILESKMMLPGTTAPRLPWHLPFRKG